MRVICVILCLLISTTVYTGSISTTAYAESILWATKHSSTNLEKDQEWLALLVEETIVTEPLLMEATREESEIEPPAPPEGPQDLQETMEETAEDVSTEPIAPLVEGTEATPLEILIDSTTPDEIQEYAAPEEYLEYATQEEGVEEIIEPIDKTGENQNS